MAKRFIIKMGNKFMSKMDNIMINNIILIKIKINMKDISNIKTISKNNDCKLHTFIFIS